VEQVTIQPVVLRVIVAAPKTRARVFKHLKLKQGMLHIHRASVLQEYLTKFVRALEMTVIINYIIDLTPDTQ
jgi:hypothetical protein